MLTFLKRATLKIMMTQLKQMDCIKLINTMNIKNKIYMQLKLKIKLKYIERSRFYSTRDKFKRKAFAI
jgi:hypothetical protein